MILLILLTSEYLYSILCQHATLPYTPNLTALTKNKREQKTKKQQQQQQEQQKPTECNKAQTTNKPLTYLVPGELKQIQ